MNRERVNTVIKIGFVDRYLDNWHANHYPEYIKMAADEYGIEAAVTYAYAQMNHPDEWGLTTEAWCKHYECTMCHTYEELIAKSDVIMVMCADDCLPHEELAWQALSSGKPVYCDKTFAPDEATARRMFDQAKKHNTPIFSCSAQRFCKELIDYKEHMTGNVDYCASMGPGDMVNYSIHQYEMLQCLMGIGAKRCRANVSGMTKHILYEYEDGRICTFTQGNKLPFYLVAGTEVEGIRQIAVKNYYGNFMKALLEFFQDGKVPVEREDTLEIMRMQEAGRKAIKYPDIWVALSDKA